MRLKALPDNRVEGTDGFPAFGKGVLSQPRFDFIVFPYEIRLTGYLIVSIERLTIELGNCVGNGRRL